MTSNWQDQAACRDEDPELFFPIGDTGPAHLQAEEAKAVCSGCPVRQLCLDLAMQNEANRGFAQCHGIYGGCTPTERFWLRTGEYPTRKAARAARLAAAA